MAEKDKTYPETLLKAIKSYENKMGKGRLKIFLGMSAGVGKTYSMLEEAQKKKKEGVNVIAGIVETHGRQETAQLLEGLPVIPEKIMTYREKQFKEFNIDEALKMKPQLLLIDELAHTNVPGSRHLKRWQDVIEILEAGINIYGTLTIQHIESLKDIIEEISNIKITESVPDLILDRAAEIELVDITPEELLQRLREGKVYTGELSEIAIKNFFQEDRLTALREIALRFTAEVVDQELIERVALIENKKGWRVRERLLVAINHQIFSSQLIRMARRRAFSLHASWIVFYVDTGKKLSEDENATLAKNLALARELGAEVITTKDVDIAKCIIELAQQKDVTQIIIGKNAKKIRNPFKPSIVNQLISKQNEIAISIFKEPQFLTQKKKLTKRHFTFNNLYPYLYASLATSFVGLFSDLIVPFIGYKIVGFIFLLAILALSFVFKKGPLLWSAFLSAVIWDYFFIPPIFTFYIYSSEDIALLVSFFLVAAITGQLTSHIKQRQELLTKQQQSTQAIYEIVREIAGAPSSIEIFQAFKEKVGSTLEGECEIIIKNNGLIYAENSILKDDKEKAVANWVFENGKEAGWSTSTLPSSKNLCIPLKGWNEVLGVLAFCPHQRNKIFHVDELNFLYTVSQQLANYLFRFFSEKRQQERRHLQQLEKIHVKILTILSKELLAPLGTIEQAMHDIKNQISTPPDQIISSALYNIESSKEALLDIQENAFAMAKLGAGSVKIDKTLCNVQDLLDKCTNKVKKNLKYHHFKTSLPKQLPKVSFDFSLMETLLNNLLLNAIKFSPANSTIELEVETVESFFILSVSDEGPGIPEKEIPLIFERFYRMPGTAASGLGLGLAIVSSIAEIHNGWIKVQNRPTGGSKFSLYLPL